MQSDRELLEAAAKAAGMYVIPYTWNKGTGWDHEGFTLPGDNGYEWNPLEDDGDALRLAAALGLVVDCSRPSAGRPFYSHEFRELDAASTTEGVRRAIVRAAAALASQEGGA